MLSYTAPTSRLAGKRLTLSYVPADQATADLIASYLPKPHADGSPIQASELPTSLPGYLIRLKPQISLEGQVVAQGTSVVTMGTDLQGHGGFTQLYDPTQWDLSPDASHVAGQATAIGISAGGISAKQLDSIKTRLEVTKNRLQANSLQNLTGEQVSGDLLTAVIWSWFAAAESHNRLSQNQAQTIENPGLSYGLFHALVQPVYSWGVARQVTFPGANIDIGHIRNVGWAKDNDGRKWVIYNLLRGQYMSALEHAVPEQFFSEPQKCDSSDVTNPVANLPECPRGISAVKALEIAAAQGQKIYTITQEVYANNPNIVSVALSRHSYGTQDRVRQSLAAGYEVTIHEAPIMHSKWVGAGLIQVDPSTGSGAYTIEGGSNGGAFYWVAGAASGAAIVLGAVLTIISLATATGFLAFLGIVVGVLVAFLGALNVISAIYYGDEYQKGCFAGGFFMSVGMVLSGMGLAVTQSNMLGVFGAMFPSGSIPQCFSGG